MSQASCPSCQKPIDPTHAPVARIVGAKIVTYCSKACADGKPETVPAVVEETDGKSAAATKAKAAPAKASKASKASKTAESDVDDNWDFDEPSEPAAKPAAKKTATAKPKATVEAVEDVEDDPEPTPAPAPRAIAPVAVAEPRERSMPVRGRKRKTVMAVCGFIFLGGAALAVIDGVSPSRSSDVSAGEPRPTPAPALDAERTAPEAAAQNTDENADGKDGEAAPIEPAQLLVAAPTSLRELRSSPSRRVVRLATMALARTGDEDAITGVRELLKTEESALNRMALAYALARAGQEDGRAELYKGLEHKRRDVRSDAAIGLLNIGDDGGKKTLRGMMNFRHHKIAACGHLAKAGDEKAKALLIEVYKSRKSDPESSLRAAVALGRAGDASVAPFLRTTLDDGRFQVGAADALATLGDRSSIKPLTVQLGLNAMRVRAALALRRLDAEVSLEPLAVALTEDDEVTRVTAAEAIVILTGPKEVAARD